MTETQREIAIEAWHSLVGLGERKDLMKEFPSVSRGKAAVDSDL